MTVLGHVGPASAVGDAAQWFGHAALAPAREADRSTQCGRCEPGSMARAPSLFEHYTRMAS